MRVALNRARKTRTNLDLVALAVAATARLLELAALGLDLGAVFGDQHMTKEYNN